MPDAQLVGHRLLGNSLVMHGEMEAGRDQLETAIAGLDEANYSIRQGLSRSAVHVADHSDAGSLPDVTAIIKNS